MAAETCCFKLFNNCWLTELPPCLELALLLGFTPPLGIVGLGEELGAGVLGGILTGAAPLAWPLLVGNGAGGVGCGAGGVATGAGGAATGRGGGVLISASLFILSFRDNFFNHSSAIFSSGPYFPATL